MFEIKFQSAGISPRPNVFSKIDTAVVYASKSNIFIITLDKKTSVIVRDSCKLITFLYTFDNYIVISDINGSAEMYSLEISNGKMTQKLVNCCDFKSLLSGVYVTNDNAYIGITMDKIMIGNSKEIQAVQNTESIPSYVTGMTMGNKEYITVAYEDGKLDVYEYNAFRLDLAYSVNAHQNGIKCAKIARFESSIYLVTASLDTTLKVWRYESTDGKMTVNLLDILNGHNDWVFGCEWSGRDIISASGDNSVIVWKFDGNNKWSLENRLGGIREKNQTFFAAIEIHGNILAHSLSGGAYFYEKDTYKLRKFFSGHTDEITSLDVNNDYIMTTSLDFTTRIYSTNLCEEIGRPQIHGYSVMCAKFLKKAKLEIVSGADETILRIYKPTKIFLENYSNITKNQAELREIDDDNSLTHYNGELTQIAKQSELSLTNENSADRYDEILAESNTERNLSTNLVFAECLKVYGHYFEICNVAVCDRFIATVNKSKNFEFSGIFIWDYNYNKIDYIKQHDLNIVKLCFSADGEYLMAASRDTKVSIYKFMNDKYVLQHVFTEHNRIVNDCGISIDRKYAFSVSKDRKVVMYDLEMMKIAKVVTLENEITSLAVFEDRNAMVVGLRTGYVAIYKYGNEAFELLGTLRLHAGSIKCVMFADKSTLVTGGSDGMLNIIKINY